MYNNNITSPHLRDIGENYVEHFIHSITYSVHSFIAGIVFLIHAFIPDILVRDGSIIIEKIASSIMRRNLCDENTQCLCHKGLALKTAVSTDMADVSLAIFSGFNQL